MNDEPKQSPGATPVDGSEPAADATPPATRFPELETLQQEVARRIRDNQKFLDGFLDEDYVDDDPATAEEDPLPEDFEEL